MSKLKSRKTWELIGGLALASLPAVAGAECVVEEARIFGASQAADTAALTVEGRLLGDCAAAEIVVERDGEPVWRERFEAPGQAVSLTAPVAGLHPEAVVVAHVIAEGSAQAVAAPVLGGAAPEPARAELVVAVEADSEQTRAQVFGAADHAGVAHLVCVQPCLAETGALRLDLSRQPVRAEGFAAEATLDGCDHPSFVACALVAGAAEEAGAFAERAAEAARPGDGPAVGFVGVGIGGPAVDRGFAEEAAALGRGLPYATLDALLSAARGRRLAGSLLNDPTLAGVGLGGMVMDFDAFGGRLGFGSLTGWGGSYVPPGVGAPDASGEVPGAAGSLGGLFPDRMPGGFYDPYGFNPEGVAQGEARPGDVQAGLGLGGAGALADLEGRMGAVMGGALGSLIGSLTGPSGGGLPASPTSPSHAGSSATDGVKMLGKAASAVVQTTARAGVGAVVGIVEWVGSTLVDLGRAASGETVSQRLTDAQWAELDAYTEAYDAEVHGSPYGYCSERYGDQPAMLKHCVSDKQNGEEWDAHRCSDAYEGSKADQGGCDAYKKKKAEEGQGGSASGGSKMCSEEPCDDTGRGPFTGFPKLNAERAGALAAMVCGGGRTGPGRPSDPDAPGAGGCEALTPVAMAQLSVAGCQRMCTAAHCDETTCDARSLPSAMLRPPFAAGGVNDANTNPGAPPRD